jgi:diguanylate cyclase (GGDEF)-like protein/PAS domain S-box-containing protein
LSGNALTLLHDHDICSLPVPAPRQLYPLAALLLRSRTVKGGLQNALSYLVQEYGWALGLVWQVRQGQLRFAGSWHQDHVAAANFLALSRVEPFRLGESLPRTVLDNGVACVVSDIRQGAHMVRYEAARHAGLKRAVAWPLRDDAGLLGVLELYGSTAGAPGAAQLGLLDAQCRDIARFLEARRFDERLRTQHAQLAQAQRIARLAYWEYLPESASFHWTDELAEWLGLNMGHLPVTLDDYMKLVHPDDRNTLRAAWHQLMQAGSGHIELEHRVASRSANLFHVLLHAEAQFDDQGEPERVSGTLQDITEQKRAEARVQASERRWLAAFRNSPLPSFIIDAESRCCQAWNDELIDFLGMAPEQVQGRTAVELGLWSLTTEKRIVSRRGGADDGIRHLECRMRHKEGDRFLLVNTEHLEIEDRDAVLVQLVDITSRKRLEQSLRLTVAAVEHSGDALVILSMRGRIISVNPAFTRITGYADGQAIGRSFDKLLHDPAGNPGSSFFREVAATVQQHGYWEGEVHARTRSANDIPVLLSLSPIRDDAGKVTHYVSVFSDISRQKDYEHRLRQMALHDSLTGLPNRRLFIERGNQALLGSERHDQGVSVLFIDLDKFKPVNDKYGHAVGDALLVQVAQRLASVVRSADTVARLGGDEFVVLLPELSDTKSLVVVAKKIIHALGQSFDIDGQALSISASVGIARYPNDGADIESLLRAADDSLYRVKEAGRNDYCFSSNDPS